MIKLIKVMNKQILMIKRPKKSQLKKKHLMFGKTNLKKLIKKLSVLNARKNILYQHPQVH